MGKKISTHESDEMKLLTVYASKTKQLNSTVSLWNSTNHDGNNERLLKTVRRHKENFVLYESHNAVWEICVFCFVFFSNISVENMERLLI